MSIERVGTPILVVITAVALAAVGAGYAGEPDENAGARVTFDPPPGFVDAEDEGLSVAILKKPGWPKVYLVTFREGFDVDATTDDLKMQHALGELYRYRFALKGAALVVPGPDKLRLLRSDPRVAAVKPDAMAIAVDASGYSLGGPPQPPQTIPAGIVRVGALQTDNEGTGMIVAVLDSGIDLDHPDLADNIHPTLRFDCVGDNITQQNPGDDGNGHGSHVAGIIGALNNAIGVHGAASEVDLASVRVLNKQAVGTWGTLICGIDYVTEHFDSIRVANMSIGAEDLDPTYDDGNCGYTNGNLVHQAICSTVSAGVTYAVSAGNDGVDASNQQPASFDEVITVSAYWHNPSGPDPEDWDPAGDIGFDVGFPWWTNFGLDVDLAAPGVNVWSTYRRGKYAYYAGTSMAAPHVAAAAAMYIRTHPNATPAQVRQQLIVHGQNGYYDQGEVHPEPFLDVSGF